MPRPQVPKVDLERLPHRHAVIRLRQAYGKLGQLEAMPKADNDKSKKIVQEVTK